MGSHVPRAWYASAQPRRFTHAFFSSIGRLLCAALVAVLPVSVLADGAGPNDSDDGPAVQPRYTARLSVLNGGQPRGGGLSQEQLERALADRPDPFAQLRDGDLALLPFGTQTAASGRPIAADFNGDGHSVTALFLDGEWFIDLNDNGAWDAGDLHARLGGPGDQPLVGDWDGDGKADIGVFGPDATTPATDEAGFPDAQNDEATSTDRPTNDANRPLRVLKLTADGSFRADPVDHVFTFDSDGGIAVAGDFNGDGIDTIALFRDGHWWIDVDGDGQASDADLAFEFGTAGDQPIVGDFDGDGVDQVGIFRNGRWLIDANNSHSRDRGDKQFKLGQTGDLPTVGDWDGDGIDQAGVYRPPAAPSLSPGAERGRQSAVGGSGDSGIQ